MDFTHLHVHTEYSLLDGAARIKELAAKAKELGFSALAITDHGSMYGAVEFYSALKDQGIKPIIGSEMYITRGDMRSRESRGYAHLVLLAKNEEGYKNLMRLSTLSFTDGFYYRPRIDYTELRRASEGLICLTACISGDIPSLLLEGRDKEAREVALELKDIFGEDLYIEIQDHGLLDQKQLAPKLMELAKELDIKPVVTNDVHYVNKEDARAQEILMCVQMVRTLDEGGLMDSEELYLKSAEEMAELFPQYPELMANTMEVAEKCNLELSFGGINLPVFDVPEGYTNPEYLEHLVREGMKKRYGDYSDKEERMLYELETIKRMGFTDYFLIVQDYVNFAKRRKIMVGAGRGSAAGSIVAYALGITNIDPIKYGLFFERFLNPERVSMPDIDIDFCYERRQEVVDYLTEKYGRDRVAKISTFGTLGARQVVRDVARVMHINVAEADRIAKMIPRELKMTIPKALEINAKLRAEYENSDVVREWLDMSMKLEGLPRHSSTHAAGVVIANKPVTEFVPLARNPKDDSISTQYTMKKLESLGLLKMDLLGLRTLTVLRDTVQMVKEGHGVDIDIDNLDFDDKKVYELISSGETDGIFQLESGGMRSLMTQLRPENLGDIMVGISLFRPGPMAKIPDYIAGKNAPDKITYDHPVLERVLKETYGCMVYQEQVMEIVRDMAGYSLGRSDLVRRAMAKKNAEVMEHEREIFIHGGEGVPGAVALGADEKVAKRIFSEMMDFAEYAFNKSHACAYAVIAYQTAYMKCYYEPELMCALLNSFMGTSDKLTHYMGYLKRRGIKLLTPDINASESRFTVENGAVRFGLSALRNVGDAISAAIDERKGNGLYASFEDFVSRNADILNKAQLEALILSGCFDGTGAKRSQLMAVYEKLYKNAVEAKKREVSGQLSIFDMSPEAASTVRSELPNIEEFPLKLKLSYEKEKTGLYISAHPLDQYANVAASGVAPILDAENDERAAEYYDGRTVELVGIFTELKTRITKINKQMMANAVFEDLSGSINVTVFPKMFSRLESRLAVDEVVVIKAEVAIGDEAPPELYLNDVRPYRAAEAGMEGKKLYLRLETENVAQVREIKGILRRYVGGTSSTLIYAKSTGRRFVLEGELAVAVTSSLIEELEELLGKDNVVCK